MPGIGPQREMRSFCRICAAACGVTVAVEGDQVVQVRGDADHPGSRGYTCSKGRALGAWHHREDRLDDPRVRGARADWGSAVDDLARSLGSTIAEHGADAIAMYLATGFAYDSGAQVAASMWMGTVGSSSFYSAATVDNAPVLVAAERVAGHPMLNPVWDPTVPGTLLMFGSNPVVSHGYGTTLPDPVRHLRDYRRLGGTVWVIDPRRTETAASADHHLAVRPGSDVEILGWLTNELLASQPTIEDCRPADIASLRAAVAPFTIERAIAAADIGGNDLRRLLADVRSATGRLAIFCGTGLTMARDGILAEWLRWALLIITGSLDVEGGMRFNRGMVNRLRPPRSTGATLPGPRSRPELPRVAGQMPAVALVDEIEAGNIRALVLAGGNPITALPSPGRTRAALRSLDVLVVIDVVESELSELATHVLPAAGQLERADLSLAEHVSLRSAIRATTAVVPLVGRRRPVWWMFASLARAMGRDLLGGADPDSVTDEKFLALLFARSAVSADDVFAAGPAGFEVPIEFGWVRREMLPDGHWNLAPADFVTRLARRHTPGPGPGPGLVLVPRREMAWSNSVMHAGSGDEPVVRMHPDDARDAGVTDGSAVRVTSDHGRIDADVRLDAGLRRGVVSITHGRFTANPGTLTSSTVDVDPITTMPRTSGITISLGPRD